MSQTPDTPKSPFKRAQELMRARFMRTHQPLPLEAQARNAVMDKADEEGNAALPDAEGAEVQEQARANAYGRLKKAIDQLNEDNARRFAERIARQGTGEKSR